jgi:UDP-2,4-diacetamido-2,4,6-trideoxy-beta-L-altropyranose hydrolase
MQKIKILFKTAGGRAVKKELGLGHIFRCINLASKFSSHEIHFLVENFGGVEKILNKNLNYKIKYLEKDIQLQKEIENTKSYITKNNIDILIIDRYKINKKFVNSISKFIKTVIISDLKNINYHADLVVNGFIGFDNQIIKNKFGTRCLLGPKYQILNKNFKNKNKVKKKYDLLITLGGFDENKIIQKMLKQILNSNIKLKIKIISGPVTKKLNKNLISKNKKTSSIELIEKTNNMFKEISSSKFGICAGGITSYEFATLKVPFAIISQVKHQLTTAKEWQEKGIGINLGMFNSNFQKKLERILNNLNENEEVYKFSKKHFIDADGSKRITKEIIKILKI